MPMTGSTPRYGSALRRRCARNATTYLTDAVVTKEVTNQRLWGAMGLATAARALGEPTWFTAVHASIERSLAEQHADGSFPYHPEPVRFGLHPGAADVSVYYQARVLAYLWQALAMLGEDAGAVRGPTLAALRRGLDFLVATYTPAGAKCAALEGKRWFWPARMRSGVTRSTCTRCCMGQHGLRTAP